MDTFTSRLTINPEKRFGKPCVRNTRITVGDVLGWLASGMTFEEILFDFDQFDLPPPTVPMILPRIRFQG